jgi:cytochrome b561
MGYGNVARVFHWLTVLFVFATIPVGWIMTQELPRPTQNALFILHKNLGVVILLVVVARIGWRLASPPPPAPLDLPPLQRVVSTAVHLGLYALLLTMALSGYVRVVAGGFPIEMLNALGIPPLLAKNEPLAETAKAIHATAIFGLVALIALHVGAAGYHGLVRRDGVLARMWPPLAPRR